MLLLLPGDLLDSKELRLLHILQLSLPFTRLRIVNGESRHKRIFQKKVSIILLIQTKIKAFYNPQNLLRISN